MQNLPFLEEWTWWQTFPQIWREQWRQKPWVCHFPFCIFPELFCFALVLKCGGLHILGLGGGDFEGTSLSYPLGESSVAAYSLISVGVFTLLECPTWWIYPSWRSPPPDEGLGLSDMEYIAHIDTGSSVMPLGEAWVSDPGGGYWGPGSSESSCQDSMVRGILEDSLRCHSFARVNVSCVARSQWSYTSFFQFPGTAPFLMCSTVENVLSKTTWYQGGDNTSYGVQY